MTRLFAFISLISISILFAYRFTIPASAAPLSSQFGVTLSDPNPGANSTINFVFNQTQVGESGFKKVTVTVPAGFEFTPSDHLDQDELVGGGTFIAGLLPDGTATYNTNSFLYNDQMLDEGQVAHWRLVFGEGLPPMDVFVTADQTSGHTLVIELPPEISLPTPIFWGLGIFGISPSTGAAIVRNPPNEGKHIFKAEFISSKDTTSVNEIEVSIGKQLEIAASKKQEIVKPTSQEAIAEGSAPQNILGEKNTQESPATKTELTASTISQAKNKFNSTKIKVMATGLITFWGVGLLGFLGLKTLVWKKHNKN